VVVVILVDFFVILPFFIYFLMYQLSDFQIWKVVFLFYRSFQIRGGRTVGLNYGRLYVSQVHVFISKLGTENRQRFPSGRL